MAKQKSKWQTHLMKVYHEMKSKNPSIRLQDAMKKAKENYRK